MSFLEGIVQRGAEAVAPYGLSLSLRWRIDDRGRRCGIVAIERKDELIAIWLPMRQRLELANGYALTAVDMNDVIEKLRNYFCWLGSGKTAKTSKKTGSRKVTSGTGRRIANPLVELTQETN